MADATCTNGTFQRNTFRTRHSRSILCGDVQRQRGWRWLAAPLSVETPWMWAQYHCDLQRSKGVRLIINDDYTHKYIIHVLNQFDQDIHSRQRQTDELFCNIHITILVSDHQNGTYGRDQKQDRQSPDLPRIAIASTEVTHNK